MRRLLRAAFALAALATLPISPVVAQIGGGVAASSPLVGSGASANYLVGPGDLLSVTVYRAAEMQATVRVTEAGTITLPSLGALKVMDMTAARIAELITVQLKTKGIYVNPVVNVLVAEVRSKIVSVLGAVGRPGEIALDRPGMTLAAVLARAGAEFGTGSAVVTVMDGQNTNAAREQFRIGEIVGGTRDRLARPGEILVVQAAPTFYISGEVQHAGAFPVEPGLTVGQAIALGGGATARGTTSRVRLTRRGTDGTSTELKGVKLNTPVMPNDLIVVRQRVF